MIKMDFELRFYFIFWKFMKRLIVLQFNNAILYQGFSSVMTSHRKCGPDTLGAIQIRSPSKVSTRAGGSRMLISYC